VRATTVGADLRRGGFQLVARARGKPDFGARVGKRARAGSPDAAAGTRNEGDAAVEAEAV